MVRQQLAKKKEDQDEPSDGEALFCSTIAGGISGAFWTTFASTFSLTWPLLRKMLMVKERGKCRVYPFRVHLVWWFMRNGPNSSQHY